MTTPPTINVDRLSALLERFRVRAHLFHTGPLCGVTRFTPDAGLGFLHVMRQGEMVVTHRRRHGAPTRMTIREPSLLFYPRPLAHDFHHAPTEGTDFCCATLEFDGGAAHPLVRALPPVIVLPVARVDGLTPALALLFAETEKVRCGQRLIADRMFEVLLLQLLRWLLDHPDEVELPVGLLTGLAHPGVAKALVAIHQQPGAHWSLEQMAQTAGMSRSAFAPSFRALVGETPGDYLARWRIAIAQTQLREGAPLKAVAQRLGYANASALSRVFTQKVGVAPRAWLRARQVLAGP